MNKFVALINPAAGRSDPEEFRRLIEERFRQREIELVVRESSGPGDIRKWAAAAASEGHTAVLAAGGDGTVAEAVDGILDGGSKLPLAHIPRGTANLLAKALSIPSDPAAALDVALSGHGADFDVGYLPDQKRSFMLMAAIGFPAKVVRDAPRPQKDRLGFAAYVLAAGRNLSKLKSGNIRLTVDGRQRSRAAHTVMMTNIGNVQGLDILTGQRADPHDGKLLVTVIDSRTPFDAIKAVWRLLRREARGEYVEHFAAESLRVSSRVRAAVQIDGESLEAKELHVKLRPGALRMLVPRDYPNAQPLHRS